MRKRPRPPDSTKPEIYYFVSLSMKRNLNRNWTIERANEARAFSDA